MNDKLSKHIKSFQQRWNVSWDENTAFTQYKNRLLYLIEKHLASFIVANKDLINEFAYLCGLQAPYSKLGFLDETMEDMELQNRGFRTTMVHSVFQNSEQPLHLSWYLQNLFSAIEANLLNGSSHQFETSLSRFIEELKDLLEISPVAQMRLSQTNKGIVVYPAGAKLLDEKLVNDNLVWLQDYPESFKAYEQALAIYLSGDKPKFRNLIDNLRVAMEQLLRKVLNNQKSLENQSKDLDNWLETHEVQKQVRNLYGKLLFGEFSTLQNDVAKHGDVDLISDEIEFLIYITGTFMRLIIQLSRSET